MKKELIQKAKDNLKTHFVGSTALLAASTPIFAVVETMGLGMSNEVSLNARLLAAGLTYGGLGFLAVKGRDSYRKFLKITDKTKERTQQIHDSVYGGLWNLAIAPPFYYAAGVRDIEQIAGGTAIGILFGLTSGGLMGYAIDTYRDLTGIKESARVPESIRNKSSKFKLGLAAAITATSIALTAGVYGITNEKKQEMPVKKQGIEKIVNTNYSNQ
ncbi:MAG: hypothetical protein AABY15_06290 [Nanoarchaeota archaeon]